MHEHFLYLCMHKLLESSIHENYLQSLFKEETLHLVTVGQHHFYWREAVPILFYLEHHWLTTEEFLLYSQVHAFFSLSTT